MRVVEIEPTLGVHCTSCGNPGIQALVLSEDGLVLEVVEIQCVEHAEPLEKSA